MTAQALIHNVTQISLAAKSATWPAINASAGRQGCFMPCHYRLSKREACLPVGREWV